MLPTVMDQYALGPGIGEPHALPGSPRFAVTASTPAVRDPDAQPRPVRTLAA